ncbi:hypothetical protein [Thermostichus vulcanus]|uniref:Uncharacterized protein n=1 Tax=Thermostichus vulcanus str. 'Rupite' TaxID=2813851 RepID=A0ABT0C6M8_THEVL|nr:hypothetical protein [Thermostichus vulcanus]MCJ2541406.1 hypothetical protein [Thermostichus vulcanus str. 'Rupite']
MSQSETWLINNHWISKPTVLSPFPHLDPTGQAIYVSALERHIHHLEHILDLQAKGGIDSATAQASLDFLVQQLQRTRHDLLLGSPSLN